MDTFVLDLLHFMLKCKTLLECTNLFSPNEYEMNDKIILKCFQYPKMLKWKSNVFWLLWNWTYSKKN